MKKTWCDFCGKKFDEQDSEIGGHVTLYRRKPPALVTRGTEPGPLQLTNYDACETCMSKIIDAVNAVKVIQEAEKGGQE